MDTITIGVLLPSSTIFPIAKDFEKGLKAGLKPLNEGGIEVNVVKEFIGQGEIKLTENACKKFFDFDDVDLVTGFISNKAAVNLADKFKKQKTPLIISNTGGHIPDANTFNEYMFVNSMNLWRHAYTLGNWAVKQFGKKGMYVGSVYDAGYSFSHLFAEGMAAADSSNEWSFSVPPMPPPGSLTDMSVIFPFLEQYQPDFILANFCGAETTLFLNEFINRGWHHKTKVLGLPYLLSPFEPLIDDITIYTTQPFDDLPEISATQAFYQLGLQAGENIAKAATKPTSRADLRDELANLNLMFNVDTAKPFSGGDDQIAIIENSIKANAIQFESKRVIDWATFPLSAEVIKPLTAQPGAGWFNPYLCV